MKNIVPLLFLLLFAGSSFTYRLVNGHDAIVSKSQKLKLDVKIERPQSSVSNDGSLLLNVSGGSAPYTVQVISTFNPSQVYKKERIELKNLGAGNYTIVVQDADKQVLQETIELTPLQ